MILAAGTLAGVVAGAVVDALVVGLGAEVVGDGEGVLGGIGLLAVAADAAVYQGVLNAGQSCGGYPRGWGGGGEGGRCHTGSHLLYCGVAVVLGSWRQIRGQEDCWSLHHFSADSSVDPLPSRGGVSITSCGQRDGLRVDGLGGSEPD